MGVPVTTLGPLISESARRWFRKLRFHDRENGFRRPGGKVARFFDADPPVSERRKNAFDRSRGVLRAQASNRAIRFVPLSLSSLSSSDIRRLLQY